MATLEQLEMLAGRALLDEKFLADLLDDPQLAAHQVGVHLGNEQVARLKEFRGRQKELYQVIEQIRDMRKGIEEIEPSFVRHVAW